MQLKRPITMKEIGPYIYMGLSICIRYFGSRQTQNTNLFANAVLTWFACLFFNLCALPSAFAQAEIPELSVLPWQVLGVDNEFVTRNKQKLETLRTQLQQSLLTGSQPLDLLLEAQGRVLPYNLKHSIHPVASGKATFSVPSPSYVVPIICGAGDSVVVATQLVTMADNFLLGAKQLFTTRASWEGKGPAPVAMSGAWAQDLQAAIRLPDAEVPAFKVDFALLRSSHSSVVGAHECLNMLVAHELQKTMMVPTPLDLLEGYRLRQLLYPGTHPRRSTRTLLFDWGRNPMGPKLEATLHSTESVLGSTLPAPGTVNFELKPSENRLALSAEFAASLTDYRSQLLTKDKPQVSKIYGAWVYLDRGRAWGLEMNDRLYFDVEGRFVKGHVVGFFGAGLKLKSPRGFDIQEGAIVYIRKGQRIVKVGDSFDFDPTAYPTPWPPVRQPSMDVRTK